MMWEGEMNADENSEWNVVEMCGLLGFGRVVGRRTRDGESGKDGLGRGPVACRHVVRGGVRG